MRTTVLVVLLEQSLEKHEQPEVRPLCPPSFFWNPSFARGVTAENEGEPRRDSRLSVLNAREFAWQGGFLRQLLVVTRHRAFPDLGNGELVYAIYASKPAFR